MILSKKNFNINPVLLTNFVFAFLPISFVLGNLIQPVYEGEIQNRGLSMDVNIFDDKGFYIKNTKGELVCKKPFPSMPIKF